MKIKTLILILLKKKGMKKNESYVYGKNKFNGGNVFGNKKKGYNSKGSLPYIGNK